MTYSIIANENAAGISRQMRSDARRHPQILAKSISRLAFFGREDSKELMKRELDRPKPFTVNAVGSTRATTAKPEADVFVNKNNTYLHFMVFGGVRQSRGRILVPDAKLRTDRYGNLSRAKRRRIVASPKTFVVNSGGRRSLVRRVRKRLEFVGGLEQRVSYKRGGYWGFFESTVRTYDRRFNKIFNQEHTKAIRR